MLYFDLNIIEVCSQLTIRQNRRQAIIWTNAGPDFWRIYVSLELDESTLYSGSDFKHIMQHFHKSFTLAVGYENRKCTYAL